jgi:hypothetical protein
VAEWVVAAGEEEVHEWSDGEFEVLIRRAEVAAEARTAFAITAVSTASDTR